MVLNQTYSLYYILQGFIPGMWLLRVPDIRKRYKINEHEFTYNYIVKHSHKQVIPKSRLTTKKYRSPRPFEKHLLKSACDSAPLRLDFQLVA